MLSPIAPHIAEELWEKLGHDSITYAPWPTYDEAWTVDQEVEIVVQVNGKIVDRISIAADTDEAQMEISPNNLIKLRKLSQAKQSAKLLS